MKEVIQLLGLLGLAIVSNMLGGIYLSINVKNIKFDWTKFVNGIIKAVLVVFMVLSFAYILEKIPSLSETVGIEPKAMIVGAITIYIGKVGNHLITIFGLDKNKVDKTVEQIEEKLQDEYVDM